MVDVLIVRYIDARNKQSIYTTLGIPRSETPSHAHTHTQHLTLGYGSRQHDSLSGSGVISGLGRVRTHMGKLSVGCAAPSQMPSYQGSFALSTGMNFHAPGGIDRRVLCSTAGQFSAGDEEGITASQPKLHLYIPRAFVPRSEPSDPG